MNRRSLITCLAAVLLGLGLGWGVRRWRLAAAADLAWKQDAAATTARAAAQAAPAPCAPAVRPGDPGALERHFSASPGATPWLELVALAESTPVTGFPRLLESCAGNSTAWRMVAASWAARDPQGMMSALAANPPGEAGKVFGLYANALAEVLFGAWMKTDRAAAIAAARSLGGVPRWQDQRMSLSNAVLEADPAAGLALMKTWSISTYGPSLTPVKKWFERDPAGAVQAASEASGLYAGRYLLAELGKLWGAKDPKAAFAAGAAMNPAGRKEYDSAVAAAWGEQNPKEAAAAIEAVADPARRFTLGSALVGAWAKKDPQAALDWAVRKFQGVARSQAIASVVGGLFATDAAAANALLADLQPVTRAAAVERLVEERTNKGDGAATLLPWIFSLPDEASQGRALDLAAWRFGAGDPAAAALILEHSNAPALVSHGAALVRNVASQLARNQPQAALEWAMKLPGRLKSDAADQAASVWLAQRPAAAREHALAMPAGSERAQFIESLTYSLTGSMTMGHEPTRQAGELTSTWLRQLATPEDRAAARAAIDRTPAGDEKAAELLRHQWRESLK